jgi:hypothetical protein
MKINGITMMTVLFSILVIPTMQEPIHIDSWNPISDLVDYEIPFNNEKWAVGEERPDEHGTKWIKFHVQGELLRLDVYHDEDGIIHLKNSSLVQVKYHVQASNSNWLQQVIPPNGEHTVHSPGAQLWAREDFPEVTFFVAPKNGHLLEKFGLRKTS